MMFGDVINKLALSRAAKEATDLLRKYQDVSPAAKKVLAQDEALFKKAINMEIEVPLGKGYLPPEFWQDGELFSYTDLLDAIALFGLFLRGLKSVEALKKAEREMDAKAQEDELALLREEKGNSSQAEIIGGV